MSLPSIRSVFSLHRLVLILLAAAPLLLWLLWLSDGVDDWEEEVMEFWGPLVHTRMEEYLTLDEPLSPAEIDRFQLAASGADAMPASSFLSVAAPDWRANAAIYMLVGHKPRELGELTRALTLLHQNFNARARYPMIFFQQGHLVEMRASLLRIVGSFPSQSEADTQCEVAWQCDAPSELPNAFSGANDRGPPLYPWQSPLCRPLPVPAGLCLPWRIVFAVVDFAFPPSMPQEQRDLYASGRAPVEWDKQCAPDRIGYRHMCRTQMLLSYHPMLAAFEFYWRLDDDSEVLSPVPYDPFRLLSGQKRDFGWVTMEWEYLPCSEQFQDHVAAYRHQLIANSTAGLGPGITGFDMTPLRETQPFVFYNNFELGRLNFWRRPEVRHFFHFIDESHGTFRWRWGDAPIRTAALSLFMPREKITFLSQLHYRHERRENYPEESVKRRVWRSNLRSPLPNAISFHLVSWMVMPALLIGGVIAMYHECRRASVWKGEVNSYSLVSQSRRRRDFISSAVDDEHDVDLEQTSSSKRPADEDAQWYPPAESHSAAPSRGVGSGVAKLSTKTYDSMDALKCACMLTVIFIHSMPVSAGAEYMHLERVLHDVFAVPGMLLASGFLFDHGDTGGGEAHLTAIQLTRNFSRRLLPSYLVATVVWFVLQFDTDRSTLPWEESPVDLVIGYDVNDFVFVIFALFLFSLILRRMRVAVQHFVLLIAFLAYRWAICQGIELRWWCRHPLLHLPPFMVGWIARHYAQAVMDADAKTAKKTPNSLLSIIARTLQSVLLHCRCTLMCFCLAMMVGSILTTQHMSALNSCHLKVLIFPFTYSTILLVVAFGSEYPRLPAPLPRLVRFVSECSFPIYLYHLFVVDLLRAAFTDWLTYPWYAPPPWITSAVISLAMVRALRHVAGVHAPLLLGCTAPRADSNRIRRGSDSSGETSPADYISRPHQ